MKNSLGPLEDGRFYPIDSELMKNSLFFYCFLVAFTAPAAFGETLPQSARPLPNSAVRETHEEPPVPTSPEEEESRLTKNWGGPRRTLSERGIDVALIYKLEMNRVLSGGIQEKTETLGNLDLRLSLDGEKMVGAKGVSAFIYVLGDHGGNPSANIGDNQVSSNIETSSDFLKLHEAWIQQLFREDRASILVGLHDLNSEFYVTDASTLFFNSSFGVGRELSQSGENGPAIFPNTAPALRIRTEPSKDLYLQWAAFNAVAGHPDYEHGTHYRLGLSDGQLLIVEMAHLRGRLEEKVNPGKYALGMWTYTSTFPEIIDTSRSNTNSGAYFLAEQTLGERTTVFFRFGSATSKVNQVSSCMSGGLVLTGVIPGREKDRLGFAFTTARNGDDYMISQDAAGTPADREETALEISYRFEPLKGISIQPDFQRIIHPGMDPAHRAASVFATRLEANF